MRFEIVAAKFYFKTVWRCLQMGIERIAAPVSQAQRQTIRRNISEDDIVELAGSRKPPKTLQKERGVWNFLTSPFVLGSIVVAEALRAKDSHALSAEDGDPAADHGKGKNQAAPASDQDQAAGGVKAADETGGDQPGSSGLASLDRNAPRDSDLPREENAKPPAAHGSALDPPAADGGGGGGGGGGGDSESADTASDDVATFNTVLSVDDGSATGSQLQHLATASPEVGPFHAGLSTSDAPSLLHTTSGVISTLTGGVADILSPANDAPNLLHTTSDIISTLTGSVGDILSPASDAPNLLHTASGVISTLSGGVADFLSPAGDAPSLLHTASGVISTLTGSAADILSPDGLGSALNLKDIIGFDVHVDANGGLVATDTSNLLDLHLVDLPVSNVVTAVTATANALPLTNALPLPHLDASNVLNDLFDGGHHTLGVTHLSELISATTSVSPAPTANALPLQHLDASNVSNDLFDGGHHPPGAAPLSELISATTSVSPASTLGQIDSNIGEPLQNLSSSLIAGSSHDGSLPVVGNTLEPADAGNLGLVGNLGLADPGNLSNSITANQDVAPARILGDATNETPGHSIDFPAPAVPEGDPLFLGNHYTDYHVALQTTVATTAGTSVAETLTDVTGVADTSSLVHADPQGATNTAPAQAQPHQEAQLTHIATALDDLNSREHTH
jgi:hypothetical protein